MAIKGIYLPLIRVLILASILVLLPKASKAETWTVQKASSTHDKGGKLLNPNCKKSTFSIHLLFSKYLSGTTTIVFL